MNIMALWESMDKSFQEGIVDRVSYINETQSPQDKRNNIYAYLSVCWPNWTVSSLRAMSISCCDIQHILYCLLPCTLQSCPTLCDPIDSSPPGSAVHGILQARILEWVATPFSRGSSQPRSPALQADSLLSDPDTRLGEVS